MSFLFAGGTPENFREQYMIKDSEGYIASTKEYVRDNPDLFVYVGHYMLNSVLIHVFQFVTAP